MSQNFGKDIRQLTEEELFQSINHARPEFGSVCQYELLRRLTEKNSQSSEKFAKASSYLALASIIISLLVGAVQIIVAV